MPLVGESEEQANTRVLAELHALIQEHGWAVRTVTAGPGTDDVEFAYTVGLTALRHPEVIVLGLPNEHAATFLNLIGDQVWRGRRFEHGTVTGEFVDDGTPVVFLRAEDTRRLTAVRQVYGEVDVLQMVWPDSTGRLPWQQGYRNPPELQPFLGPPPATE